MNKRADSPWTIKVLVIFLATVLPVMAALDYLTGQRSFDPTGTVIATILLVGIAGALRFVSRKERRSNSRSGEEAPEV